MSAQHGAPGFRRPQLATPSYTASAQGSAVPAHPGETPVVRRKAVFVAAATLCAPALAAMALAAIGATGGGGHAAMGSLAGTEGLQGTTTPSVSTSTSPDWGKLETSARKGASSESTASRRGGHGEKHPSPQAPARTPAHKPPATAPPH